MSEDRIKLMRVLLRSGFCDIEGVRWVVWSDWMRWESRREMNSSKIGDPAARPS
jgi:hypothetical protein